MSISTIELIRPVSLGGDSGNRSYRITGTTSETDARSALLTAAPSSYSGLPIDYAGCRVEPMDGNPNEWLGTASYKAVSPTTQPVDTLQLSADFGGESWHVESAAAHIASYPGDGYASAPNHNGGINWDGQGYNGVDLPGSPSWRFAVTRVVSEENIQTYLSTVIGCVNKTNASSVTMTTVNGLTITAGAEQLVLFNAGLSQRSDSKWEARLSFGFFESDTNVTVRGVSGVTRTGSQYLWVETTTAYDETSKQPYGKVVAVHVERVYKTASFTSL